MDYRQPGANSEEAIQVGDTAGSVCMWVHYFCVMPWMEFAFCVNLHTHTNLPETHPQTCLKSCLHGLDAVLPLCSSLS